MNQRCLKGLVFSCILTCTAHAGAQELILNGGFETGDLTGWNASATGIVAPSLVQTTGTVSPFDGGFFAGLFAAPATTGVLTQDGAVPSETSTVVFDAWYQTEDADNDGDADAATFSIVFLDSAGAQTGSWQMGPIRTANLVWEQVSDTISVPPGSTAFTFSFASELRDGMFLNTFLDNVSLSVENCPADINNDGSATPADFTAWLGCFNNPASAPFCDRADVNNSGSIEPSDFTAWLAAFNAGC